MVMCTQKSIKSQMKFKSVLGEIKKEGISQKIKNIQ